MRCACSPLSLPRRDSFTPTRMQTLLKSWCKSCWKAPISRSKFSCQKELRGPRWILPPIYTPRSGDFLQSTNQSINQSINQTIKQSINQSNNQLNTQSINQSFDRPHTRLRKKITSVKICGQLLNFIARPIPGFWTVNFVLSWRICGRSLGKRIKRPRRRQSCVAAN